MKNSKPSIALRILVGAGIPILAFSIACIFFKAQKTPPCIFYELTGLYCVGCGTGRAALSVLRLDLLSAFRYNPLMFILSPVLIYYVLKKYVSFVFGKDILPFPKIRADWIGTILVIIVIAFWILRNIPFAPFSYLAP
jgi:hypothetical protein